MAKQLSMFNFKLTPTNLLILAFFVASILLYVNNSNCVVEGLQTVDQVNKLTDINAVASAAQEAANAAGTAYSEAQAAATAAASATTVGAATSEADKASTAATNASTAANVAQAAASRAQALLTQAQNDAKTPPSS